MAIETVFAEKFESATQRAYVGAIRVAPFTGFGYAMATALTYFAEGEQQPPCFGIYTSLLTTAHLPPALLFYIGAILIINGRYDFGKMLTVFSLVLFSVTFASQIMTYRTSTFDASGIPDPTTYAPSSLH